MLSDSSEPPRSSRMETTLMSRPMTPTTSTGPASTSTSLAQPSERLDHDVGGDARA